MQRRVQDHLSGIRAAIDEGATIVTHQSNRAFLERVAKSSHTIVPDRLASSRKAVRIQTVGNRGQLTDGMRTIELHRAIGYEHAGDMLIVYLLGTRLFSPKVSDGRSGASVSKTVRRGALFERESSPRTGIYLFNHMTLAAGTRLGVYQVVAAIGSGGMGEVYRARHEAAARRRAESPARLFALDPGCLARFQREAQVLASLNHPNIVAIHGFEEGPAEAGHYVRALVLELVEGPTLAHVGEL